MNYDAYMLLWQNTFLQVKHIEYINKAEVRISKVLTYSTFLIVTAGDAQVVIDEQPYHVQRFTIFHIGKSQCLQITAQHRVSYFLIGYKGSVMYRDAFYSIYKYNTNLFKHAFLVYLRTQSSFTTFFRICIVNGILALFKSIYQLKLRCMSLFILYFMKWLMDKALHMKWIKLK